MHKKIIICLICILLFTVVFTLEVPKEVNAEVTEEWVARYNGPDNGKDFPNTIAIDVSGNIYITGWSWTNETYYDYLTVAYDPLGNEIWTSRYDGPVNSYDYPYDITVDEFGNIYVTGKSSVIEGSKDEEHMDFATVSYDSFGNQRWVARYNGPGNGRDIARRINLDQLGNVYVTGESRGINSEIDYVTIAFDSDGNQLWISRYNGLGNNDDYPNALTIDSYGIVYVTGFSTSIEMDKDYATVAYSSLGNQLWVARYNGPVNDDDEAVAIDLDSSGNIYVTGWSRNGPYYNADYATIAYDSSGNKLWVTRSNTTGNSAEYPRDIVVDNSGNIYVTGGIQNIYPYQDFDYLTIAYNSNGNLLWMTRYNGSINDFDHAHAITLDPHGNVIVTGRSKSGPSSYEYATVAYDPNGNELWVARYQGPGNGPDNANDIIVDSCGNIFVTGYSYGSGTDPDYTTIKYSRPMIQSTIDIDPNTLNLKSKGRWITCYIDLPGYDVNDLDIDSIMLEDTIPAEWGDVQNDTLMVKFDRSEVEDMLSPGTYNLKVTGELTDGTKFEGYSDEIRVIDPP